MQGAKHLLFFQCINQLDEEEKSDVQLKEQFKERWTRTASGGLTKPMRDECQKYKTILDTAIGADKIVQDKYGAHKHAFALLSKPAVSIATFFVKKCLLFTSAAYIGIRLYRINMAHINTLLLCYQNLP